MKRRASRKKVDHVRDHQLNIRLSTVEVGRFAYLADHYDLAVSDMVRMLVKREHDKISAEEEE